MDPVLERILSLIPKKDNGDFVFGAKKRFCDSIGITSQNLSDWIAGRSQKYMDKLLLIASVYGVSYSWLKGDESVPDNFDEIVEDHFAEREALNVLRTNPATRTLLMAGRHLTEEQINNFAKLMESMTEGKNDAD